MLLLIVSPGTTYTYDALNRLIEVKDAWDKVIQENIYNTRGLITKQVDAVGYLSAATDAARYSVEYDYDIGGRVTGVTASGAKERAGYRCNRRYGQFHRLCL